MEMQLTLKKVGMKVRTMVRITVRTMVRMAMRTKVGTKMQALQTVS